MSECDSDFLTPSQLSEKYPAFNKTWLTKQLFMRKKTGLSSAVAKIGNRLFIDEAKFLAWVDSHREGSAE